MAIFDETGRVEGIAGVLPYQGEWGDTNYLTLLRLCNNRLVELAEGHIAILPHPTCTHQGILGNLTCCEECGLRHYGKGLIVAPFAVRLAERTFRMPDISLLFRNYEERQHEWYRDSAELVVEIVNPDDPDLDWITKKSEYAAAGIPEYWIADPRDNTLTIFTLDAGATEYRQAGRWGVGETAASMLLERISVEVGRVFESEHVAVKATAHHGID